MQKIPSFFCQATDEKKVIHASTTNRLGICQAAQEAADAHIKSNNVILIFQTSIYSTLPNHFKLHIAYHSQLELHTH